MRCCSLALRSCRSKGKENQWRGRTYGANEETFCEGRGGYMCEWFVGVSMWVMCGWVWVRERGYDIPHWRHINYLSFHSSKHACSHTYRNYSLSMTPFELAPTRPQYRRLIQISTLLPTTADTGREGRPGQWDCTRVLMSLWWVEGVVCRVHSNKCMQWGNIFSILWS